MVCVAIVIGVVAVIGLLLAVLHGTEAATWSVAYLWLGAFASRFDAMLFSVGSMTTVGAPGLVLERHMQLMGVLEAANGVLLFGISTAYLFGVMQPVLAIASSSRVTTCPNRGPAAPIIGPPSILSLPARAARSVPPPSACPAPTGPRTASAFR